jgi:outer membrane protein TolC
MVPAAHATATLGLRDALRQALRGNLTLASTAADAGIASAQLVQSEGAFDWTVNSQLAYSHLLQGFFGAVDTTSATLGVAKTLSSNGKLELRGDFTRSGLSSGTSGDQVTYVTSLTLNFTQPLLRDFGSAVAMASVRRGQAQREVALLNRRATVADTVRAIIGAYWELAYATRDVQIRGNAVGLAREQLRLTHAQIQVGKLAPVDLLGVERAIAQREGELAAAEATAVARSVALRRALGLPLLGGGASVEGDATGSRATPTEESPLVYASDTPDAVTAAVSLDTDGGVRVAEAVAQAFAQNPTLASARKAGERATIDVEVTSNGLLPQLDLNAFVGPTARASSAAMPPTGLSDALGNLGSFADVAYGGSLTFSYPIGDRAARGAADAARYGLHKAKLNAEDIERQIAEAVVVAVFQVRTTAKRIEATRLATRFAQQALDAERAKFDVGRATNFNVLERQNELKQTQLDEARAAVDYLATVAQLEALTGRVLDHYHIDVRAPASTDVGLDVGLDARP